MTCHPCRRYLKAITTWHWKHFTGCGDLSILDRSILEMFQNLKSQSIWVHNDTCSEKRNIYTFSTWNVNCISLAIFFLIASVFHGVLPIYLLYFGLGSPSDNVSWCNFLQVCIGRFGFLRDVNAYFFLNLITCLSSYYSELQRSVGRFTRF